MRPKVFLSLQGQKVKVHFAPARAAIVLSVIAKMAFGKDIWNLEKQFVFYASYHNNAVNVAIHLLCIWPILISGTLLLQHVPAVATLGDSIKVKTVVLTLLSAVIII